jgi:hypothetical protein
MTTSRRRLTLWLAAVAARLWAPALPPGAPKPTPRQERLFGRPFACLVRWRGVLVPVEPTAADEGDARAERRWLEAAAAGMRN